MYVCIYNNYTIYIYTINRLHVIYGLPSNHLGNPHIMGFKLPADDHYGARWFAILSNAWDGWGLVVTKQLCSGIIYNHAVMQI